MINPQIIRDQKDLVIKNTQERGMDSSVIERWFSIDEKRKAILREIETLQAKKNEIADLGKEGLHEQAKQQGKDLKEKLKDFQKEYEALSETWEKLIQQIPNLHGEDVPRGKSEKENKVLKKVGNIPVFDFEPKDHIELGKELDLIDFEAGSKVTGSKFYFLKNGAVQLELALMQFGLDYLVKKGFTPIMTPDLAKSRYYLGTGYSPKGDEAQIYEIEGDDLGLIATAEITMAGLHADEILKSTTLPLRYAAISHCFRREAGAYGKFSKGLYRVHQFTKLEMFAYCAPEQSAEVHQEFLHHEEAITQMLGLPYQVVEMCTGDLGAIATKKYDLEAWMPGRNDYGEITSTSNTGDFQSRNLKIKYKAKSEKNEFVHMLNGTALVSSRIPVAIFENYQQKDGSIRIPEVLQNFMGGIKTIEKKTS